MLSSSLHGSFFSKLKIAAENPPRTGRMLCPPNPLSPFPWPRDTFKSVEGIPTPKGTSFPVRTLHFGPQVWAEKKHRVESEMEE